ncbi:MAG: tRNA (N(6)-L-threonylcarbamoyladenosine(37)-C(2))-methylthiotransferase MtaB [Eubacteriales bacterium]|nr:tRNA (N(6)-L-threonylcarbamoyladenosine(37)-C(2))-methylthiotransferase MtaB [Eubacteriales bacterium]
MSIYSVGFYTLGCKVSQYETEAMSEIFEKLGFRISDYNEVCDVYVINTCTVTAESDRKSRQIIRRAKEKNPSAVIMVCGCYSQRSPEEVAAIDGVSYVCGTNGKTEMAEKALQILNRNGESITRINVSSLDKAKFEKMSILTAPRTRAYLKIEDGCDCRCTYCAIPDARGPVRSKPKDEVIAEINALSDGGTKEIVLTGIETASYGSDFGGYGLIDLLEEIEEKSSVERIRLSSLTPEILRDDFIHRICALKKPVPHFHISMQSGSNNVLRAMKRRYNTEQVLKAMEHMRSHRPEVMFTTDMMVGFPGESDSDFEDTLEFTGKAGFLDMHVFAYSKRKNTPAALYAYQIDEKIKRSRSERLCKLRDEITAKILAGVVSEKRKLSVVFETYSDGIMTGHSAEYIKVSAPSDKNIHGEIKTVIPQAVGEKQIFAEIAE